MSKITTVIQVMEQMRKQENMKIHINGEVTSGDEVVMSIDKDVEGPHGVRGHGRPHGSMRGGRFAKAHGHGGMKRFELGEDDNPHEMQREIQHEKFVARLKEMGFTEEELKSMKANRDKMMQYRPKRTDKMIMGLKMIDRMEEVKDGDHKQLTLRFSAEDIPASRQEMKQMRKEHMGGRRMSHMEEMKEMKELKEALEAKGFLVENIDFEEGQVTMTIDAEHKVSKVDWLVKMNDETGRELFFKGEGIPA